MMPHPTEIKEKNQSLAEVCAQTTTFMNVMFVTADPNGGVIVQFQDEMRNMLGFSIKLFGACGIKDELSTSFDLSELQSDELAQLREKIGDPDIVSHLVKKYGISKIVLKPI